MIDLGTVKAHLRVDGDEEDILIQGYTEAAFSTFELWTNRTLIPESEPLPDPVGNALEISKAIRQGALMLIGHWYANRESVVAAGASSKLPLATEALWLPHRWVNV